jgi:prepilin-type N-terminal cleavage/methylation domain-containing protein
MRRRTGPSARRGFTLLEVLLAMAIGLLLLAALYVAIDLQLKFAETGRDVVQQSVLARSLLARIHNDVAASLGPPDMGRLLSSSSSSSSQSGQGSQTTQGQAGQTSQPSQTTPTTSAVPSATFTLAVQGDAERLTLFVTRLPQSPRLQNLSGSNSEEPISDMRRITYWLAGGGAEPMGLARQEITLVTSDDATAAPEEVGDEASFVIAEEVKSLSFSYFDGQNWVESWEGTAVPAPMGAASPTGGSANNGLPVGPPLAVAVTLGLAKPGGTGELKQFRHVIAIPTANGIR